MPGMHGFRRTLLTVPLLAGGLAPLFVQAQSTDPHASHTSGAMDHSAHMQAMEAPARYTVSRADYTVPNVSLLDQNGKPVLLGDLLNRQEPVALNFIFTTCTTICPVMTATFSKMINEIGPAGKDLRVVSISIDPEYDTPRALKEYAAKFHAGANWQFLTGSFDDITRVQKALEAYTGDKMNHRPVTFFRGSGAKEWIRIDGLANGTELANEYRKLSPREEAIHRH